MHSYLTRLFPRERPLTLVSETYARSTQYVRGCAQGKRFLYEFELARYKLEVGLLSLFKFKFSHHMTAPGRKGDLFFGFDKTLFALGNCLTVGAGCKRFLSLPRLLYTRLRAVPLFTLGENRDCTMACMSITVYSGSHAIAVKQQFATIEIDHGACLRHEVYPYNTSGVSMELTH